MKATPELKILKKALSIIKTRSHWAKGSYALDKNGVGVLVESPKAFAFCASGVITKAAILVMKAGYDTVELRAWSIVESLVPKKIGSIVAYNDNPKRKHSEIVRLFERAVAKAEKAA